MLTNEIISLVNVLQIEIFYQVPKFCNSSCFYIVYVIICEYIICMCRLSFFLYANEISQSYTFISLSHHVIRVIIIK